MAGYTLNVPYLSKNTTDETEYIGFRVIRDLGSIEEFSKNKKDANFKGLSSKTRVVELSKESYAWVNENSPSKAVHTFAKPSEHLVLVQCSHAIKPGDREFALDPYKGDKHKGQYNLQHITRNDPDYEHIARKNEERREKRSWADDDENDEDKGNLSSSSSSSSLDGVKDTTSASTSPGNGKLSYAAAVSTVPSAESFPALPSRPTPPKSAEKVTAAEKVPVVPKDKNLERSELLSLLAAKYALLSQVNAEIAELDAKLKAL